MDFKITIGLEIHIQLNTFTKLFCSCENSFGAKENTLICEICVGYPGTLPHLNEKVVEKAIQLASVLNSYIQEFSRFDRKHYFYPDLPKGYQISQFYYPIAKGGFIKIDYQNEKGESIEKKIPLKGFHIEEDAGKLIHDDEHTLIDLNRSGVPLLEIVTEPSIESPEEAILFLEKLKTYAQYVNVSDCSMEKGFFRCDANISLAPRDSDVLGNKVELKNLNSFKFIKKALEYEIKRQKELLEKGEKIPSESRSYNVEENKTVVMRAKEESVDYAYLPDADIQPIIIHREDILKIKAAIPEIYDQKYERYINEYQLNQDDANIISKDRLLSEYFETCLKYHQDLNPKKLANWIRGSLLTLLNENGIKIDEFPISSKEFASLIYKTEKGELHGSLAKDILKKLYKNPGTLDSLIKEINLESSSIDPEKIIDKVIAENSNKFKSYQEGKESLLQYFIGLIMKESKGTLDPKVAREMFIKKAKK